MSVAFNDPILQLLAMQAENKGSERSSPTLSVVSDLPVETAANGGHASRVEVIVCCASVDLVPIGRIFDALNQEGCVPMAMPGAERDPRRLTESALGAGPPRLYVVCKTRAIDGNQVHRLVEAFARARGRGRHQLLVLEVDPDRVYGAVSQIRRGADQLRQRVEARSAAAPTPARVAPQHQERARIDTCYAMHSSPNAEKVDRVVIDVRKR